MSISLRLHGLFSPWNSPGQNTRVDSLPHLQGIFPIQGLNPGLLHCRQILYQLSHKGSPRILGWVAYPFTSRSSWPRIQPRVSCNTAGFFTNWVIREAKVEKDNHYIYPYVCSFHWSSFTMYQNVMFYYFFCGYRNYFIHSFRLGLLAINSCLLFLNLKMHWCPLFWRIF